MKTIVSLVKGFIDRTFSFLVPEFHTSPNPCRLPLGKKMAFILTQNNPDENQFADIFPRYERFLKAYGAMDPVLVRACGVGGPDDAARRPELMQAAEEAARRLVVSSR